MLREIIIIINPSVDLELEGMSASFSDERCSEGVAHASVPLYGPHHR
jgi:hypothetical protein